MKKFLFLFLSVSVSHLSAQISTTVRINEIMQSNIDNYFVDHDFPDSWVELQNITDEDIDLYDFRIGGKENADCAYRIPEHYVLRSHGFIVICCDKKIQDFILILD